MRPLSDPLVRLLYFNALGLVGGLVMLALLGQESALIMLTWPVLGGTLSIGLQHWVATHPKRPRQPQPDRAGCTCRR